MQWSCPKCNLTHQGPTTEPLAWAQQVGRDRLVREQRALAKIVPIWRRDPVTVSFDGGRTWHSAPQ